MERLHTPHLPGSLYEVANMPEHYLFLPARLQLRRHLRAHSTTSGIAHFSFTFARTPTLIRSRQRNLPTGLDRDLASSEARTYTFLMPGLLVYRADSRIKDHYRRAARFPQFDPALHDVSDRLDMDERIDHKAALSALPDDERNIFTHCFREGLSQAEIAERLSISTRTVRRKLNAAFTHLQEFLQGEAWDPKSSER